MSLYTPEEDATLLKMAADGFRSKQIAIVLGRSLHSVSSRRNLLYRKRIQRPQPKSPQTIVVSQELYTLMRANVEHLVDLKRAGHSPTMTELPILPDQISPMRLPVPLCSRSLIGSFAAMCTDIAG